jgi:hypothetical protein
MLGMAGIADFRLAVSVDLDLVALHGPYDPRERGRFSNGAFLDADHRPAILSERSDNASIAALVRLNLIAPELSIRSR